MTGSDLSRRRIPLMSAESGNPGPVVWLTGCGHGDEVSGIVVIQEIFKLFQKEHLLNGALYAFPLMNPIGFESASRNITLSKEDLNRSFPGNKNGSLAERIADIIFTTILKTSPSLVLDLHNDWMKSVPYTLLDSNPNINHDVFTKAKTISEKTGFLIILDTDELTNTLSYSLIQHGIPALTIELGESFVVNEINVEYGVRSIFNILDYLGMIEPVKDSFKHQLTETFGDKIFKFSQQPVSSTSGIIRFLVRPGDIIRKNQSVAKIYNSFGKLQETIIALNDGIVLGNSDSSVAFPGAPVMAFAVT